MRRLDSWVKRVIVALVILLGLVPVLKLCVQELTGLFLFVWSQVQEIVSALH